MCDPPFPHNLQSKITPLVANHMEEKKNWLVFRACQAITAISPSPNLEEFSSIEDPKEHFLLVYSKFFTTKFPTPLQSKRSSNVVSAILSPFSIVPASARHKYRKTKSEYSFFKFILRFGYGSIFSKSSVQFSVLGRFFILTRLLLHRFEKL